MIMGFIRFMAVEGSITINWYLGGASPVVLGSRQVHTASLACNRRLGGSLAFRLRVQGQIFSCKIYVSGLDCSCNCTLLLIPAVNSESQSQSLKPQLTAEAAVCGSDLLGCSSQVWSLRNFCKYP